MAHWLDRAACKGFPTAIFFPAENDEDETSGDDLIAKQICAGCAVQTECRREQFSEPYGVRANSTAFERGFGVRGRVQKGRTKSLRADVLSMLAENPGRAFTAVEMNAALVDRDGRGWPRNSLNSALRQTFLDGMSDRSVDDNRQITYRWKGERDG